MRKKEHNRIMHHPSIATWTSRNLLYPSVYTSASIKLRDKEISSSPARREAASKRAVSRRRAGITVITIQERTPYWEIFRQWLGFNSCRIGWRYLWIGLNNNGCSGRRISRFGNADNTRLADAVYCKKTLSLYMVSWTIGFFRCGWQLTKEHRTP